MSLTPEQIARAAGLGPEHPKVGIDSDGPDVYWFEEDGTAPTPHYIGPDYPRDPGACAQDLLTVLCARGCWIVANSANTSVFADGMLGSTALAEAPDFARAICEAVVATQPKEQSQ
jgi:hypothetical protein